MTEALLLPADLPFMPTGHLDYGAGVAMRGDTLFVGAPKFGAGDVGRVFVYERDGVNWVYTGALAPDQPAAENAGFGRALDVDGDVLAVTCNGALVVFREVSGVWQQEAEFIEELTAPGGFFFFRPGQVAVGGGRIAVADTSKASSAPGVAVFADTGAGWAFESYVDPAVGSFNLVDLTDVELTADALFIGIVEFTDLGGTQELRTRAAVFNRVGEAWDYQGKLAGGHSIHARDGAVLSVEFVDQFSILGGPAVHVDRAFVLTRSGGRWVVDQALGTLPGEYARGVFAGELIVLVARAPEGSSSTPLLVTYEQVAGTWVKSEDELLDPQLALPFGTGSQQKAAWDLASTDTHVAFVDEGFELGPANDGGAVVLRTSPFGTLESGELAGSGGVVPVLSGAGPLSASSNNSITLSDALPLSTTALLSGLGLAQLPFKGGVLVPTPDLLFNSLLALSVNAQGEHRLAFQWPAGIPAGTKLYLQHWVVDPAGPRGYSASNGLELVAQ